MSSPTLLCVRPPAAPAPGSRTDGTRPAPVGWSLRAVLGVLLVAALAGAAWLPYLHVPLTSDEGGFWLLGRHLSPGTSLYGDYWVDRPPLLVWLFSLAGHLSGAGTTPAGALTVPGVKLLGAAASAVSVVLAAVLATQVAPRSRWARPVVTVLSALLLADPLLGMPETDGEVLALPFVLLGLVLLVGSLHRRGAAALALAAGAGVATTAAALVKQSTVDVAVLAVVLLVTGGRRLPGRWSRAAAYVLGAGSALLAAVLAAAARGTSPAALWNAVVTFRLHASAVIGSSASASTPARMTRVAEAFLGCGAAALLLTALTLVLLDRRGPREDRGRAAPALLVVPAMAMVGWELCVVALGGSYWLHYLTGLVPGLVLLSALALRAPRPGRGRIVAVALCLVWTATATAAASAYLLGRPDPEPTDAQVESYLRAHGHPSDGVVVGFGHANIVAGSGMQSPYPELWSLPVRVRDPRLTGLRDVLDGPHRPRWVVVAGDSLGSWGLEATAADRDLAAHYVEQVTYGDWHVWEHRTPGGG